MNKQIKQILKKIVDNGFEAYIVGGYVRDKLLGITTYDIDIATTALPSDLIKIFPNAKTDENYGSLKFNIKNYNFDITTFREEVYKNGKLEINYIKDINKDALRRDFTINAIYMDYLGNFIDPFNGINDLQNKNLKVIGNPNTRYKEDPLRILRTIRFKTKLNFKIENNTLSALLKNRKLLNKVSLFRKKEELNKIFIHENKLEGLDLITKYNLQELLEIKYDRINFCTDPLGIWAQINFSPNYPFTKQEKNIINKIIKIKEITNETLYQNGLYISFIAGEILGIDKKTINNKYKNLPIKEKKDIKINYKKIINLGYKENEINDILRFVNNKFLCYINAY